MKRGAAESAGIRRKAAEILLAGYKRILSPMLHAMPGFQGSCRFQPTCSEYAAIAVAEYGLVRGGLMAAGRLLRCHPLHRGGFDPVRPKRPPSSSGITSGQIL
jgi:hypothetical protein